MTVDDYCARCNVMNKHGSATQREYGVLVMLFSAKARGFAYKSNHNTGQISALDALTKGSANLPTGSKAPRVVDLTVMVILAKVLDCCFH